jgi:hypothetical protein
MTDKVYLNAAKTAVVDQFSAGKKWQVSREEAAEMGLLDADKPKQERRAAFDATKATVPKVQRRRSIKRK